MIFTGAGTDVAATETALRERQDDIASDQRRLEAQLASLVWSEMELTAQFNNQCDELMEFQQLEREVNTARLMYQTFLTRLQEASVQRGLQTADSRILSEAIPRSASSPRILVTLFVAMMLGAFVGAALALIREWRFAGFRTTDELRQTLSVPVLGSLPAMSSRNRVDVLTHLRASQGMRVLLKEANVRRQTLRAYMGEGHPADGVVLTQVEQCRMKGYGYAGQYGYDGYASGYYAKD